VFDILQLIPGKKKLSQSGWHSFNAVCCHNRGHTVDKRGRGGIKFADANNWSYHCFNCGFKSGFTLGKSITRNTRQLLNYLGLDKEQIDRYSFESLQHKDLLDFTKLKKEKKKVKFKEMPLPEAELLDFNDTRHEVFIDYLHKRKVNINYPFMCTPDEEGRQANRVIIPFTYEGKIVGHTSRYLDDRKPKFISEQQSGYLFGVDLQKPEWQVCIVTEGIFDALSINGCALTTNAINDEQAEILRNLNRKIIVVPDQDKSGMDVINRALDLGFYVSMPDWDDDIKDVNDAVIKYGKLPTLLSILQSATNSKIKTEIKRKQLDKRLQH